MNERKAAETIEYLKENTIQTLNQYDFKGVLMVDSDYNNDMVIAQGQLEKINPVAIKNAKKALVDLIDTISEVRKLAYKIEDLDYQDKIQEEMNELEEIRQMIYKSITGESEKAYAENTQPPVEIITITRGGISNVSDWA